MKSMTGFGNQKLQKKDFSVEVSLRSVNGRFLELRFHLPKEYLSLETELKKILSQKLKRGTIDIFISRRMKNQSHQVEIQVNQALAKKIHLAYRELSQELKIPFQDPWSVLLNHPELVQLQEASEVSSHEKKSVQEVFEAALRSCEKERMREGEAIKKHLLGLVLLLEKEVQKILSLRSEANKHLQEKYEAKIKLRLKDSDIDYQRLSQEIVIQLEKGDINEEIQRLSQHVVNFKVLIKNPQSEGKKLDFYTQELLREVNTIGSKSQISDITQSVIEAKALIEKLREQVQNVE
ncbi:MAG: YicC/YloC family endoribonuclease [Bdellovibrionota bacterium]